MSITLKTVGIVAKDLQRTLNFYRTLGLPIPEGNETEQNVEVPLSNGITLGFITEYLTIKADPQFIPPRGQSMNLQFDCESPAGVDATHSRLVEAGYQSYAAPWDAFWGQRFARITDPDGRVVNLFADL